MIDPLRAEIWLADLDPTRGHEQAGRRPVSFSADHFNGSPAGLVVVLPITSKGKNIRSHIPLDPGTTGLKTKSYVICEQPRTIAKDRIGKRVGQIARPAMLQIEQVLRILLEL